MTTHGMFSAGLHSAFLPTPTNDSSLTHHTSSQVDSATSAVITDGEGTVLTTIWNSSLAGAPQPLTGSFKGTWVSV